MLFCVIKLVIRYNTALPSSAEAERLFSTAGTILLPTGGRRTDVLGGGGGQLGKIREKIVFLKKISQILIIWGGRGRHGLAWPPPASANV